VNDDPKPGEASRKACDRNDCRLFPCRKKFESFSENLRSGSLTEVVIRALYAFRRTARHWSSRSGEQCSPQVIS